MLLVQEGLSDSCQAKDGTTGVLGGAFQQVKGSKKMGHKPTSPMSLKTAFTLARVKQARKGEGRERVG